MNLNIVADIGGTNARFAYVTSDSNQLTNIQVYSCKDFPSFDDAFLSYLDTVRDKTIQKVCIAAAGQVNRGCVDFPNSSWSLKADRLTKYTDTPVEIINDFHAQILSLDTLLSDELHWIGEARPVGNYARAVLGPGTGLGVSAMLPSGQILPSEAGHIHFSATSGHEVELLKHLWTRYPRVSYERLLSGAGLSNLYWANCRIAGLDRELSPPDVSKGASMGDIYCKKAIEDFFAILASFAGDVALMMGASDGIYLSGGIVPKLLDHIDEESFRKNFENRGRFTESFLAIPLGLVLSEHPGLQGCAVAVKTC